MGEIGVSYGEYLRRQQFHGNALGTVQQEQAFALRGELQHATIVRGKASGVVGGSRHAPCRVCGRYWWQGLAFTHRAHQLQCIFRHGPRAIALHGIDGSKHAAARIHVYFERGSERHHATRVAQTRVSIQQVHGDAVAIGSTGAEVLGGLMAAHETFEACRRDHAPVGTFTTPDKHGEVGAHVAGRCGHAAGGAFHVDGRTALQCALPWERTVITPRLIAGGDTVRSVERNHRFGGCHG